MKKKVINGLLLAMVLGMIVSGFVSRCESPSTRPFNSYRGSSPP